MKKSAVISADKIYRYELRRIWDDSKSFVMFIGLNPSTADEANDDPTITRCINYARAWGYGGLIMANLFAFRSTDPSQLRMTPEPIGAENNSYLSKLQDEVAMIVVAWGNHGSLFNRGNEVIKMLKNPHFLEMSKEGQPKHPLYLKADLKPKKIKSK